MSLRASPRLPIPSIALLALTAAALPAPAQVGLVREDGVLGQSVTYKVSGPAFQVFGLLPSFSSGPTPLALIDPNDPRSIAVGIDLLSFVAFGALDGAGLAQLSYPLPSNPAFIGLGLYAQAFSLPGVTTLFDQLSNPTGFALGASQQSGPVLGATPFQIVGGHTVTELADGDVLIAGGALTDVSGASIPGDRLVRYRTQTQTFSLLSATLSQPRTAHTATRLADGRVLFLGGLDSLGQASNNADLYDPVTDQLVAVAPMAVGRLGHTATLLADGRVWVAGGITAINSADPIASINSVTSGTQRFDPQTGIWSSGPNLPLPRAGHAASRLLNGNVLITGGLEVASLFGIPLPAFSADCRLYVPGSNSLSNTANFSGVRSLHAQRTLSDGRVVVAGGADGNLLTQVFNPLGSVRIYDPNSGSWSNGGNLNQPRAYLGLFELSSGQLAIAGGLATVDVLTTTGTPATGIEFAPSSAASWSATANTLLTRPGQVGVSIEGGDRVLLVGAPVDGLGSLFGNLSAEAIVR